MPTQLSQFHQSHEDLSRKVTQIGQDVLEVRQLALSCSPDPAMMLSAMRVMADHSPVVIFRGFPLVPQSLRDSSFPPSLSMTSPQIPGCIVQGQGGNNSELSRSSIPVHILSHCRYRRGSCHSSAQARFHGLCTWPASLSCQYYYCW